MRINLARAWFSGMTVIGLLAGARPATAHHSFAPFDMSAEKTVNGTVKQVEWTNPHTWVWLDVTNDQGIVETWGFEGMSPNFLARRGWSRTTLKPGDKISVVFRPLRDGKHGGMFVSAKLPEGRVLTMMGSAGGAGGPAASPDR